MLKKGHVCTGQIGVDNMAEYIRSDTSNTIIDILSEDSFLSTASTSPCIDFEQSIGSLSTRTHLDECDDEVNNLGLDQAGCEVCGESPGKSDDIESCLFCANFVHVVCGTKSGTGGGVFVCRSCVGS